MVGPGRKASTPAFRSCCYNQPMSGGPKIGFLGGTGPEAKGLALRFAKAGVPLLIGSRSLERAQAAAERINQTIGKELATGAENADMLAQAEIIFLTVPFDQAASALDAYRDNFRPGQILVDVTVPLKTKSSPGPDGIAEGSGSAFLAKRLPEGVALVAAFKTVPAHGMAELEMALDCDVFVCGDSAEANARVIEAIGPIADLRPVDVGKLSAAGTLERMTALAIRINRRHKIKAARFRIVGL